ncbi:MAG: rRNA pseudouridine synthase [Deltaproteobacteria bacterium]|nr:rRNA pseudouridine synthase [Deltaproteobacteria bacterium]
MEERLQKIIARCGIASRRAAEQMMRDGRVSVNGKIITQPGMKADDTRDEIRVDGGLISRDAVSRIYLILNKPKGYVVTLDDPQNRPIVSDLLRDVPERVFPVGRLDYDSEGLLLMTNDGEFSYRVQHPLFKVPKTYMVKVRGNLTNSDVEAIKKGAMLEDGSFKPICATMEKSNRKSCWIELTILEGRNRIIRRFFDSIGHPVARLIRTSIGNLGLGELETGEYRYMQKNEIKSLVDLSGVRDKKRSVLKT